MKRNLKIENILKGPKCIKRDEINEIIYLSVKNTILVLQRDHQLFRKLELSMEHNKEE